MTRAVLAAALVLLALTAPPVVPYVAVASDTTLGAPPEPMRCDCGRFAEEITAVRALYASRGEAVTVPPTAAARIRFRDRVFETFARARCLAACDGVADVQRNDARLLVAAASFKSRKLGPTDEAGAERLRIGLEAIERCLAVASPPGLCHLWHASIRGILARGSWSATQLSLPRELLAEFRAARGDARPGRDLPDGAATRAEATLLLRAPGFVGGDVAAARRLMDEASSSPLYPCIIDNRILRAETLARTDAPERAVAELRATAASGLPTCGDSGYENAIDLDTVARCLARLERDPGKDPGWADDCR